MIQHCRIENLVNPSLGVPNHEDEDFVDEVAQMELVFGGFFVQGRIFSKVI